MNEKDYKERHLPHRINLLITFRERFADLDECKRKKVRDLFRCSKDISAMMVRRLLGDLGTTLKKGHGDLSPSSELSGFVRVLSVDEMKESHHYEDIVEVLKFANRAIAHHELNGIDHSFVDEVGDGRLVRVIDFVESQVIDKVYGTRQEYDRIMDLPDNNMYRTRFDLQTHL